MRRLIITKLLVIAFLVQFVDAQEPAHIVLPEIQQPDYQLIREGRDEYRFRVYGPNFDRNEKIKFQPSDGLRVVGTYYVNYEDTLKKLDVIYTADDKGYRANFHYKLPQEQAAPPPIHPFLSIQVLKSGSG